MFKFVQSVGASVAFLYSTKLNLYYQLYLLAIMATMATVSFCLVDLRCKSTRSAIEKSESQQNIVNEAGLRAARIYESTLAIGSNQKAGREGCVVN